MVEAHILQTGLCYLHVCIPVRWTDAEIEAFANQAAPTGISSRWKVFTKPGDRRQATGDRRQATGDRRYVKCNEKPNLEALPTCVLRWTTARIETVSERRRKATHCAGHANHRRPVQRMSARSASGLATGHHHQRKSLLGSGRTLDASRRRARTNRDTPGALAALAGRNSPTFPETRLRRKARKRCDGFSSRFPVAVAAPQNPGCVDPKVCEPR